MLTIALVIIALALLPKAIEIALPLGGAIISLALIGAVILVAAIGGTELYYWAEPLVIKYKFLLVAIVINVAVFLKLSRS